MGIWSPGPGATGGADIFTGDDSNETADGLGGNDTLNGNGGADTLTGNDGDDTLRPGDDYVADIVSGGNNYDILDYSSLVEDGIIFLGTIAYRSYFNNSSLWDMLSSVEEVIGTAASDLIFARPDGPNVLRGGAGNDFMTAQNTTTNPDFYGGAGRDYFFLGAHNYRIMDFEVGVDRFAFATITSMAISGADTLLTSSFGAVVRIVGINSLTLAQWQAHSNPDIVTFDALSDAHDQFFGGADDDWAWGGSGNDTFNGGFGDDTLLGGHGDDFIDGGNGADLLEGGSGDDILLGNVGADTIIGGSGADTATWASFGASISASLVTNTASDGDTLSGIENLTGTDQNDTLTGDGGANVLRGQSGGDALDGGDGGDTLDGGAGADVMTGGLGADTLQTDLAGLESGDQFLGGDGFDTIRVSDIFGGQQLFNFGLATISSIERIQFASNVGVSIVGFGAGQIGAGFSPFTEVVGSNGINLVSVVAVNPSSFSVENWSFTNWSGGDAVLLDGSSGNDIITGSSQADQMNGHEGVDTLNGGFGDDTFIVNLANVQAGDQYHGGDGVDTMRVGDSFAGQQLFNFGPAGVSSIEHIQFTSSTGQSIVGFRADQLGGGFSNFTHVIGSSTLSLVSIVATAPGSFSVAGWTFENWSGAVLLDGSSGGDTIIGSTQTDFISGHDGNDQLFGGFGADTIEGGAGIDLMHGEFGNDTLRVRDTDPNPVTGDVFDGGADTDTLALMTSEDVGFWDVRTASFFSIERIDYSPVAPGQVAWLQIGANQIGAGMLSAALAIDGSDRPDVLQVIGVGGAFSLENFQFTNWTTGNDYVEIDGHETLADDITGSSVEDQVEGQGGDDIILGLGGSDALQGGDGADQLFGGDDVDFLFGGNGGDTLDGGAGNDTLDGGASADGMEGGDGDDAYHVDHAGDVTSETSPAGGVDTVYASVTRTLGANLENLALTGAGPINGAGNGLSNAITGNSAANTLHGFDGDDTLDGGFGADLMFGGNGDDVYNVDDAGDVTSEVSALGGTDMVFSTVSRNLNAHIENLTLTGAAIVGAGNALANLINGNSAANTLYGFDGNDHLNGGMGADTMFGANGDDTYVVDNAGDITVEGSALGGIDTVESSISRNLNANFENLTLTGAAQLGYGNILGNVMTGNSAANGLYGFDGADTLDGAGGADQMFGANGDDTYIVDNAGDVTLEVSALGGVDTVMSSVTRNLTANLENLVLTGADAITGAGNALDNVIAGNSTANTLFGLGGADRLDGGLGADTLQGGADADTYVFSSALGAGNVDTIVGFSVADDTIELDSVVFTGLAVGALNADAFHVGAAATDAAHRIVYDSATGVLYFDADGDGGAAQIQFATLAAGLALTSDDFLGFGP